MGEQLSFELEARPALGRGDFFVSPANALAVALMDTPESWVGGKLALYGPAGSGKTHLAHVWAQAVSGRIVQASDLTDAAVPDLIQTPIAVEDVPGIARDMTAQTALFHLHNMAQAARIPLLLTGRLAPDLWQLSLADLQSRVSGTQAIALAEPDDALLSAILAKLFADRQIVPKRDVIPYLLSRMERSFEAATLVVDALDRAALRETRSLSRPLAIQEMNRLQEQEP